jgi:sugar O-acyltransferase (sialic acid O-acetyltransferase NeuD family)
MLIVGAGGFAKEVLQIFNDLDLKESLIFFDDVNLNTPNVLYNRFLVLKNIEQAKSHFGDGNKNYTIGIGNPILREVLRKKFDSIGGVITSSISPFSKIGFYDVKIGKGCNILSNVIISNSVSIGQCCLIYYGVIITHDCILGDYVEISPNVILLGKSEVGNMSQIGANSTILPNIKIGKNVIIGAGSLVTSDIPDNSLAYGVPARIIRKNNSM